MIVELFWTSTSASCTHQAAKGGAVNDAVAVALIGAAKGVMFVGAPAAAAQAWPAPGPCSSRSCQRKWFRRVARAGSRILSHLAIGRARRVIFELGTAQCKRLRILPASQGGARGVSANSRLAQCKRRTDFGSFCESLKRRLKVRAGLQPPAQGGVGMEPVGIATMMARKPTLFRRKAESTMLTRLSKLPTEQIVKGLKLSNNVSSVAKNSHEIRVARSSRGTMCQCRWP